MSRSDEKAILDDRDKKIINALLQDSRLNTNELSKQITIPQTTIHNRIKKLKNKGIIEKFTIQLNKKMIGKGLSAFIFCTVSYRTSTGQKLNQFEVGRKIKALNEVEKVSIVTGEVDLIIKVALKDVDELNNFLITKLRNIEGVERTVTSVVLSEV